MKYAAFRNKNMIFIVLALVMTGVLVIFGLGFGPVFLAGLFLYISLWMYVRGVYKENSSRIYVKHLKNLMLLVFAIWLATFVIIEGAIIAEGKADIDLEGHYALVLGAGLRGETPSISLKSRLDKAAEFLKDNKDIKAIVSGGQGEGESITEAEAMKRYLIRQGIAEGRIIKEEKSTNTKENLMFSKDILNELEKDKEYRLIVITSDFHIFRTKILADRLELNTAALPAPTPFFTYINYSIREYFALIKAYMGL